MPMLRIALLLSLLLFVLFPGSGIATAEGIQPPQTTHLDSSNLITYSGISSGEGHTCAITSTGGVVCWGDNWGGKLGDGSFRQKSVPVQVVGLSNGVLSVSAGGEHTCALTTGGAVKCWGGNYDGQLGNGTTNYSSVPVDVIGLQAGVKAITAGGDHSCALTVSGGVKCWGANGEGQLGDGTDDDRLTPVDVFGLTSGISIIEAGYEHTCTLTTGGGVKCWGDSLGAGAASDRNKPGDVSGLTSGVKGLAAGYIHSCALTTGGGVKCWGNNDNGQLGNYSTTSSKDPVNVNGLSSGISAVTAGLNSTCALTTGGAVKCWGYNESGQLGDGTTLERHSPVDVSGLSVGVSAISIGRFHSCGLTSAGRLICWGSNYHGQCGDGVKTWRSLPIQLNSLAVGNLAISTGFSHTCLVTDSGGVKCWGNNWIGQLGDGTTESRSTPVDVSGLTGGVTALAAGFNHTCALTVGGGVKCWGSNSGGQLGDGTGLDNLVPVDVSGMTSGIVQIASSSSHTCALSNAGGVKCWGSNYNGQLGDGTNDQRDAPVDVTGLSSGVLAIAAGGSHSCALTAASGVKCWGKNYDGQLGDGSNVDRNIPVDVSGLTSGVLTITAGGYHSCAVVGGGGLKCWGSNLTGQLGDGTTLDSNLPVNVLGLTNMMAGVTAGYDHTCAWSDLGGVKCWGYNWHGQLGDGSDDDHLTPVEVLGLAEGASHVSAGNSHTCTLLLNGRAKCWGAESEGQLGLGAAIWHLTPVGVIDLLPPSLSLNYHEGLEGSYFTLTGEDYPPFSPATVQVNGFKMVDPIITSETGSFIIFLSTAGADEGVYAVSLSLDEDVTNHFRLKGTSVLHPLEGGGQVLIIPAGIGVEYSLFFPLLARE